MAKVAVLGLGAMGTRMVDNLLQSGHTVIVYNRSQDKVVPLVAKGAIAATTPRAAATQADWVISMLTDDVVSRAVWLAPNTGAIWGLDANKVAIVSSTLTLTWTRELAQAIVLQGAAFLDAPVVGSRPQAEARQLIYLVGGAAAHLAKVQPILQAAGGAVIHHVGTIGQGMLMKLAVNALFGMQVVAMAETLKLLGQDGISSAQAMDCLGQLPIVSPAAKGAGSLMVAQQHAPLFPLELVAKDLRYVTQTAEDLDTIMPVAVAIREIYQTAITQGYGNANVTGVIQLFEN
ncbi:NAD(P)-dependent oxidoreductase [filamentous cyanobacterium LEGE 11480]|uniref:NAD(P)-dependent oxidoreductase n=1 Tax=Romeriopsis navalis LEGE 11480 TaxID=2777977 RepID=A0A928VS59_9CYAN|nr:NAD(P)-dependent oxidoreductase [Romeriopsis navalis]MBE9031991.1 NAD(P)-dependent oxidoreductase [Romeriopsis navalis LEGE 11480]